MLEVQPVRAKEIDHTTKWLVGISPEFGRFAVRAQTAVPVADA